MFSLLSTLNITDISDVLINPRTWSCVVTISSYALSSPKTINNGNLSSSSNAAVIEFNDHLFLSTNTKLLFLLIIFCVSGDSWFIESSKSG